MRYAYCPACGERLLERVLGDEGAVAWCAPCERPWFDTFSTCVICAVLSGEGEVALIRQHGVGGGRCVCVAGYVKPGETAEEAAAREILEETGLRVRSLSYIASYPHRSGEQLMLGFAATVEKQPFRLSQEVESAAWYPQEEAAGHTREGSIAQRLVNAAVCAFQNDREDI